MDALANHETALEEIQATERMPLVGGAFPKKTEREVFADAVCADEIG